MHEIDLVKLHFDPNVLRFLNFILGFILFGISLDLKLDDFRNILIMPKSVLVGFRFITIAYVFIGYYYKTTPKFGPGNDFSCCLPRWTHGQFYDPYCKRQYSAFCEHFCFIHSFSCFSHAFQFPILGL